MDVIMCVVLIAIILVAAKIDKWLKYRVNREAGKIGENIVVSKLNTLPNGFEVINNVKYKNAQIDHMVICHDNRVIFVIETKMWSGIITGEYGDTKWVQNKNGQVTYFDNPILQNKYHCRIVRQKYKGYSVRSIVVFVGNKNIPPYKYVIGEDMLIEYIVKTTSSVLSNRVSNRVPIDGETDWLSIWRKPR